MHKCKFRFHFHRIDSQNLIAHFDGVAGCAQQADNQSRYWRGNLTGVYFVRLTVGPGAMRGYYPQPSQCVAGRKTQRRQSVPFSHSVSLWRGSEQLSICHFRNRSRFFCRFPVRRKMPGWVKLQSRRTSIDAPYSRCRSAGTSDRTQDRNHAARCESFVRTPPVRLLGRPTAIGYQSVRGSSSYLRSLQLTFDRIR